MRRWSRSGRKGNLCSRQAIARMGTDHDDIHRLALHMMGQYGGEAAGIARVRAVIAERNIRNPRLAQTWRDVADAIERL
jgi:hypothetical protein